MTTYESRVINRGILRYLAGLIIRWRRRLMMDSIVRRLRKTGASIGEQNSITQGSCMGGGGHLTIGSHCSFHDVELDTRAPIKIGNNVIMGYRSSVVTCSHNIDDPEWAFKMYGIKIEDYVWIAPKAIILPSCRRIGRGAVIGAGAVVVKDVPPMAIMSGNPATVLRYRKCVHDKLITESLLGGDFDAYRKIKRKLG